MIRHIEGKGCQLLREGAGHSIYTNPANGVREAVPRHTEISDHLARKICKMLSVPDPKR